MLNIDCLQCEAVWVPRASVTGNFHSDGCMRAIQTVSSNFEYLENRSRGLDVTCQPVRGDFTSVNSHCPVGLVTWQ